MRGLCGLALLMVSSASWAADGLQWTWPGPRTFALDADSVFPTILVLQAEANAEARLSGVGVHGITTCSPVGKAGKNSVTVDCTLDRLVLQPVVVDSDAGRLDAVTAATRAALAPARVELLIGSDGRVRSIDLNGLAVRSVNDRTTQLTEVALLLVDGAFAALDLQLPDGGSDGGRTWEQSGSLTTRLRCPQGTYGPAPIRTRVTSVSGSEVTLASAGGGVVMPGVLADGPAASNYAVTYEGSATFDTAEHALVARTYQVRGTLTGIEVSGLVGEYQERVQLRLVPTPAAIAVTGAP